MSKILDMYLNFRQEIDKMCVPLILHCSSVTTIMYSNKVAGMLVTRENVINDKEEYNYIDALYIMPEYRRENLAKKAVIEYFEKSAEKGQKVRLHIVNNNMAARCFWNSIFWLHTIDRNHVDGFYEISGLREDKKKNE